MRRQPHEPQEANPARAFNLGSEPPGLWEGSFLLVKPPSLYDGSPSKFIPIANQEFPTLRPIWSMGWGDQQVLIKCFFPWDSGARTSDLRCASKDVVAWVGTSLLVQWLRLHLPIQGLRVQSLFEEPRSHMPRGQKPKHIMETIL